MARIKVSGSKAKVEGIDFEDVMSLLPFQRALVEAYSSPERIPEYLEALKPLSEKYADVYISLGEGGELDVVFARAGRRLSVLINSRVSAELVSKLMKLPMSIELQRNGSIKVIVDSDKFEVPDIAGASIISLFISTSRLAELSEALALGKFDIYELLPGAKSLLVRRKSPSEFSVRGYTIQEVKAFTKMEYAYVEGIEDLHKLAPLSEVAEILEAIVTGNEMTVRVQKGVLALRKKSPITALENVVDELVSVFERGGSGH